MMTDDTFYGLFQDNSHHFAAADDLFAVLDSLDRITDVPPVTPLPPTVQEEENITPKRKRQKLLMTTEDDGQQKISHITVERNRRKQMNHHLTVLRSLMPCFYVKRGDQASIIGGVVDYINELQQILQSLEAKKQRKAVYSHEVILSPSRLQVSSLIPNIIMPPSSSSTTVVVSPRKPLPSPRVPPISPRTPTPTTSPNYNPSSSANELVANSKSAVAEVEVKSCGSNVIVKTVSPRIPGQAVRIIAALEDLALEILHLNVTTLDQKLLNSFTIKIGIECQLSAEELANQVQQTFCHNAPL